MSMSNEMDAWLARQGVLTINPPCRMSRKQGLVWHHVSTKGSITLADAVKLVGGDIYHNATKHVGSLLANMVKRGMLKRSKPGVFILPNAMMGHESRAARPHTPEV